MSDLFGWSNRQSSYKGDKEQRKTFKPKRAIPIKGGQKTNHNPNKEDCLAIWNKKTNQWDFR
jgi:hypothetical protein